MRSLLWYLSADSVSASQCDGDFADDSALGSIKT